MQRKLSSIVSIALSTLAVGLLVGSGVAFAGVEQAEQAEQAESSELTSPLESSAPSTQEQGEGFIRTCTQQCTFEYTSCVKNDGCGCELDYELCMAEC